MCRNSIRPTLCTSMNFRQCSTQSDYEANKKFCTFFGNLRRMLQISLQGEDGADAKQIKQLEEEGILRRAPLANVSIYSALQNPLLLKYDFNIREFMEGAQYSTDKIIRAVGSQDFIDSLDNPVMESPSRRYLEETLNENIFRILNEKVKNMQKNGVSRVLKDVKIHDFGIKTVSVTVKTDNIDRGRLHISVRVLAYFKLFSYNIRMLIAGISVKRILENNKVFWKELDILQKRPAEIVPIGSTSVSVQTAFKFVPTYQLTLLGKTPSGRLDKDDGEDDNKDVPLKSADPIVFDQTPAKPLHGSIIYRGVISGQIPLDWKVVATSGF